MFDPKCMDLAEYFLPASATDRLKAALAQAIQDAVEAFLVAERARLTEAIENARRTN